MSIDPKHFLNLGGKQYVTFPGLLDHAHNLGLQSVTTELVQIPNAENGEVAIVKATVTMQKDGQDRVWSAYGDTSPRNVNRMVSTALIRMAETRAVARALRMATNIGETAAEELPDMNGHTEEYAGPQPTRAQGTSAPPSGNGGGMPACAACGKALTKAQQDLSVKNFGQPTCPACQKTATRIG